MKNIRLSKISVKQRREYTAAKRFFNKVGVKKADECKFKEALEFFTKAIELMPEDSLAYFNRATVKMSIGDIPGAKLDFISSQACS